MKVLMAIATLSLVLAPLTPQSEEAPTGFDNKSNGMVDNPTHQADQAKFEEIVPVSASRGRGLDELLGAFRRHLPEQPAIHSADELTDRNERFLAAEFLREKLFRLLGEELPYSAGVEIEKSFLASVATLRMRRITPSTSS